MECDKNLEENTNLVDVQFPFNIFNKSYGLETNNILYLHWHENIEIIYLTEGNVVFDIGNQSISAAPGDIIFVNSKQLHSGFSINNTVIKYRSIVFGKSLVANNNLDPHHNKYISPFINDKIHFPCKITYKSREYSTLIGYVQSIIDEFDQKKSGYEIMIKNYLLSIIIFIIRNTDSFIANISNSQNNMNTLDHYNQLFIHIQNNYAKKISVKEAASIVNLSPHYFCRAFKKLTGRTFTEFVNLYRINKAEYYLRTTNKSITEISEITGFCNIYYFDKIFKEFKNYSPTTYRKYKHKQYQALME